MRRTSKPKSPASEYTSEWCYANFYPLGHNNQRLKHTSSEGLPACAVRETEKQRRRGSDEEKERKRQEEGEEVTAWYIDMGNEGFDKKRRTPRSSTRRTTRQKGGTSGQTTRHAAVTTDISTRHVTDGSFISCSTLPPSAPTFSESNNATLRPCPLSATQSSVSASAIIGTTFAVTMGITLAALSLLYLILKKKIRITFRNNPRNSEVRASDAPGCISAEDGLNYSAVYSNVARRTPSLPTTYVNTSVYINSCVMSNVKDFTDIDNYSNVPISTEKDISAGTSEKVYSKLRDVPVSNTNPYNVFSDTLRDSENSILTDDTYQNKFTNSGKKFDLPKQRISEELKSDDNGPINNTKHRETGIQEVIYFEVEKEL
ncbi:hypothetical protein Btru_054182 [Bulinus truncatus]|nr:hypothetical protein Btru_054182 [Bulinus truncatus]